MNENLGIDSHEMASISAKLDKLMAELTQLGKVNKQLNDKWLTVDEVCKLLAISSRLLQNYRDQGLIAFSQIGHKIYIRAVDIEIFLMKNYREAFKNEKKVG